MIMLGNSWKLLGTLLNNGYQSIAFNSSLQITRYGPWRTTAFPTSNNIPPYLPLILTQLWQLAIEKEFVNPAQHHRSSTFSRKLPCFSRNPWEQFLSKSCIVPQPIGSKPRRLAKTPPKPQSHLQCGYVTGIHRMSVCKYWPTFSKCRTKPVHHSICEKHDIFLWGQQANQEYSNLQTSWTCSALWQETSEENWWFVTVSS